MKNNSEKFITKFKLTNAKIEGGKRLKNNNERKPTISIITVVLNGGKYLEDALKSLYQQKYLDYEHIVIDGGSTDNTIDIILKNEKNDDISHLPYTKKNLGIIFTAK